MGENKWTPDQPLRADATDEQIAERWHHNPTGNASKCTAEVARELATACVVEVTEAAIKDIAVASRPSPRAPSGWRDDENVRRNRLAVAVAAQAQAASLGSPKSVYDAEREGDLANRLVIALDALCDAVSGSVSGAAASGSPPREVVEDEE